MKNEPEDSLVEDSMVNNRLDEVKYWITLYLKKEK